MTQLIVMRRYPDTETKGTGIGAYSDMLDSMLDENGVDHENVYFKLSTDEGYLKCLRLGFIRPPLLLRKTDCQIYHATDELCCMPFPRIKGKKVVTFHHVSKSREGRSPLLLAVWKIAAKRAVKHSDAIIAVSRQTRDEIVGKLGADPQKVYVLEHAIDPVFRDLGGPRGKIIGFVGTLIERKNVHGGIRAFKLFTEMPGTDGYRFVICGDGPLKNDLVSLSESLGIADRVEFTSGLGKEELLGLYNEMVVFANSSMHEGLGLTALEAQACGAPVVFFKEAEIPAEATEHFVPSEDEEEFALNIYRLAMDGEYRRSVTEGASFGLSPEEYVREMFRIYSEVLGKTFP
ncbi:MAG: glycosyltransferase [Candidatus Methanomethylophilaceae archaeon]|nr:glycosyltransferase [Candidatus Methanomethylophilaceae archaeon]MDY0252757.1 glycosyltransferase [Candidatus Methanomethylophilaceae archaeon]